MDFSASIVTYIVPFKLVSITLQISIYSTLSKDPPWNAALLFTSKSMGVLVFLIVSNAVCT